MLTVKLKERELTSSQAHKLNSEQSSRPEPQKAAVCTHAHGRTTAQQQATCTMAPWMLYTPPRRKGRFVLHRRPRLVPGSSLLACGRCDHFGRQCCCTFPAVSQRAQAKSTKQVQAKAMHMPGMVPLLAFFSSLAVTATRQFCPEEMCDLLVATAPTCSRHSLSRNDAHNEHRQGTKEICEFERCACSKDASVPKDARASADISSRELPQREIAAPRERADS